MELVAEILVVMLMRASIFSGSSALMRALLRISPPTCAGDSQERAHQGAGAGKIEPHQLFIDEDLGYHSINPSSWSNSSCRSAMPPNSASATHP